MVYVVNSRTFYLVENCRLLLDNSENKNFSVCYCTIQIMKVLSSYPIWCDTKSDEA